MWLLCAAQKALTREGVPFVLVKDISLMDRAEVKDVMAYIRWAAMRRGGGGLCAGLSSPPLCACCATRCPSLDKHH